MKWYVLAGVPLLIIVVLLIVYGYPTRKGFYRWRLTHTDGVARFRAIGKSAAELKAGMHRDEVREHLGLPDNKDNEYVWFWCCDSTSREQYDTWRDLYLFGDGPQAYILFDATGHSLHAGVFKGAEGSPWVAYSESYLDGSGRFTKSQAIEHTESLLGPDPYAEEGRATGH